MKKENLSHKLRWLMSLPLLAAILGGCVRSDLSDCPTESMSIKVVVSTATLPGDIPIDPSDVTSLKLYVFSAAGDFLDVQDVQIGQTVELDYPGNDRLRLVAIANTNPANELVSTFVSGDNIAMGNISLLNNSVINSLLTYITPSDLFWGEATVSNGYATRATSITEIQIKRIVASVNVKIRGLRSKVGAPASDNDFSVTVATNKNSVNFAGIPSGPMPDGSVGYAPAGAFTAGDTFEVPAFYALSSQVGEAVTVYIYHGTTLIDTVTTYTDPAPGGVLKAINGKQLEVRIDYTNSVESGSVNVTILYPGWNIVTGWPIEY